jgi:peptide/nickel transport system ATP-binding protein/peptide/nickel transport system permease protein
MAGPTASRDPDTTTGHASAVRLAPDPARSGRPPRGGGRVVVAGAAAVGGILLLVLLGPLLVGGVLADGVPFGHPGFAHPLGTDDLGRDLLGQLLLGGRTSLAVALSAAALATLAGTAPGLAAGMLAGRADAVIARGFDIVLAMPFLPLVIVIGAFIGPGPVGEAVVIGLAWSAHTGRIVRSQALEARSRPHIEASLAMGASLPWVARRHLLPIVAPLLVPQFVRAAGAALIAEASLTFLGLGDPTVPSWGGTIAFGQARGALLTGAWVWWIVPPGVCIALFVTALAVLGFGLEERAQPRIARWTRSAAPENAFPSTAGDVPASDPEPTALSASTATARGPATLAGRSIIEVADLSIEYATPRGPVRAVRSVSFEVARGEVVGIVGDSGSGKSTVVMALLGLSSSAARTTGGRILIDHRDLRSLGPDDLRALRGDRVGLVPQYAMQGLDPVMNVHAQVVEVIRAHRQVGRVEAGRRASDMLRRVGIGDDRARAYPHELSGGMRQRVVIAIALANDPALLIADEPTTGLDLIVQREIADLLADLRTGSEMSMIIVSHDMSPIVRLADRVLVMAAGSIVEAGPVSRVIGAPDHPATGRLIAALPRLVPAAGAR